MKSILYIFMIITSQMLYMSSTLGGFDRLVKDVFPSGTMSNHTRGAIVKDAQAGHFVGSNLIVRPPADPKLEFGHLSPPSCKLGGLPCSAQMDLFGGSLSLISGQELVRHLKSLPQSAAIYGVFMAVKTTCPQCQNLLEYLDAKADWLNRMSIDKCKMVQSLMDPILPKQTAKKEAMRQSNMIMQGTGRDMGDIQRRSKTGDVNTKGELEDQLVDDYNLVWKALSKKVRASSDDNSLKELLMSISGTLISKKSKDGKTQTRRLKSLVNKDLIKQMIGASGADSSKIRLYSCKSKEKCLDPIIQEQPVSKGAFLFQRVQKLLTSIVGKVLVNKGQLTADEEMLVVLSSDQIILRIEMDLATYSNKSNVVNNQTEYIEALCFDVITAYLQTLLTEVQEAILELEEVQLAGKSDFRAFEEDTRDEVAQFV